MELAKIDRRIMSTYPITKKLEQAINRLFDDPSVGYNLLGLEVVSVFPESDKPSPIDPLLSYVERVLLLRRYFEEFMELLASQYEEFEEEEHKWLQAQATTLLVVLRELRRHFPEAFSEDYQKE